ncbi:CGNR zinc finger domain-containing protein [Nocardia tengchongensis]|uniref:hypothetical protein n=1 Tax=Nocardia tengchongensis TaxID=2055889 RepID=UPI0036A0605C
MGQRSRLRRCPACRTTLSRDANPRRRYCSPACVARAYRARKRFGAIYKQVLEAGQRLVTGDDPEIGIICPGCGRWIYPGGRGLRADARHCSPTCRQRDYRRRRRERSS